MEKIQVLPNENEFCLEHNESWSQNHIVFHINRLEKNMEMRKKENTLSTLNFEASNKIQSNFNHVISSLFDFTVWFVEIIKERYPYFYNLLGAHKNGVEIFLLSVELRKQTMRETNASSEESATEFPLLESKENSPESSGENSGVVLKPVATIPEEDVESSTEYA